MSNAQATPSVSDQPTLAEYRALAEFRYQIRCFLSFSERAARAVGIEPQQHQLLLALKGLPVDKRPTIRALAERLCVAHHTAVALVDRLEAAGLLRRARNAHDRREVLVSISPAGEALLSRLSAEHQQQLRTFGAGLRDALGAILLNGYDTAVL
jgi:DNA-binding MarR family transcriptional regulator